MPPCTMHSCSPVPKLAAKRLWANIHNSLHVPTLVGIAPCACHHGRWPRAACDMELENPRAVLQCPPTRKLILTWTPAALRN